MTASEQKPDRSEEGRFQALHLHAQGGIGSIFAARDAQLNRVVALKEIQPSAADDTSSRDRFLREAEITARLEHPGIVPIYGSGRHPDGRPYYAMRMIEGKSLRDAINELYRRRETDPHEYQLELRRLLNRFITVCNTMDYAHSRGVLHRDLKPENIMLGPFGETLIVDWGLAKIFSDQEETPVPSGGKQIESAGTQQRTTEHRETPAPNDATQAGTIVGTFAYMSPEQALGWNDTLTRAADIYSLGATLYALLTGRVPDVGNDLPTILVRIRNQQFPRPRELNSTIPAALEAICVKAMSPTSTARYTSAADLTRDLEAWLADEPVSAYAEPLRVRAARWMRRHRTFVTSAAGVGIVAVIALGTIVVLQNAANVKLAAARDKIQQNFDMARDAVDQYFTKVSEDPRLAAVGLEPLRRDLLATAGDFYERFVKEESGHPDVPYELGWAKFRLASVTEEIRSSKEAATQLEDAARIFRELKDADPSHAGNAEGLLFCELNLSGIYDRLGERAKGAAALDEAALLAEELVAKNPENSAFQNSLARCFATKVRRAVEEENLAKAVVALQQEIAVREALGHKNPTNAGFRNELAAAYRNAAVIDQRSNHLDDARGRLNKAMEIGRTLADEHRNEGSLTDSFARTLTHLADLEARTARTDEARKLYREAIDLRTELVKAHPDVLDYRAELATTANNFGSLLYSLGVMPSDFGASDSAEREFETALSNARRLAEDYPEQIRYQKLLSSVLFNFGQFLVATGQLDKAEALLEQAESNCERLRKQFPGDVEIETTLAGVRRELGNIEMRTKRLAEAEDHFRTAVHVFRNLREKYPDTPRYSELLSTTQRELADFLKSAKRYDESIGNYREAEQRLVQLLNNGQPVVAYRTSLAATRVQMGTFFLDREQWDDALECFELALEPIKSEAEEQLSRDGRTALRNAHAGRAMVFERKGQTPEAIVELNRAIALGTPADGLGLRLKRAGLLAANGSAAAAVSEADALVQEAAGYGPALFELAKVYATSIENAKEDATFDKSQLATLTATATRRSVDLLNQAFKSGHFADAATRTELKSDLFKKTLGEDGDYARLVEVIERGAATTGK